MDATNSRAVISVGRFRQIVHFPWTYRPTERGFRIIARSIRSTVTRIDLSSVVTTQRMIYQLNKIRGLKVLILGQAERSAEHQLEEVMRGLTRFEVHYAYDSLGVCLLALRPNMLANIKKAGHQRRRAYSPRHPLSSD